MHEGGVQDRTRGSRRPLLLRLQAARGAVTRFIARSERFLCIAALLAWEQIRHLSGDRVYQLLVVEVALAVREVGNRPADEDGYEATDERVVHVRHRVQLS